MRAAVIAVVLLTLLVFGVRLWREPPIDVRRDAMIFRGALDSSRTVALRTDFASFYYAGKASARGLDMYAARVLDSLAAADGVVNHVLPYLYPPVVAAFAQPLSYLTPVTAQRWWDAAQLAFIVGVGVILLLTRFPASLALASRTQHMTGALVVCASLLVFPFWQNLLFGQINTLVLLLMSAFFFLSRYRTRDWSAGVVLAAATLVKVTPAMLVLPMLLEKRWNVLGGFVAGILALVLVSTAVAGMQPWRSFLEFLPAMGYARNVSGGFHPSIPANFSLAGFYMRLLPGEAVAIRLLTMGSVLLLLTAVVVSQRAQRNPSAGSFLLLAYLIVMVVASPVTWLHHLIYLVPGVVFVLRELLAMKNDSVRRWGIASVAILSLVLSGDFQRNSSLIPMSEDWRPVFTSMNLWFLLLMFGTALTLHRLVTQRIQEA